MTVPKPGYSKAMRGWMKVRRRAFTAPQICDELGVNNGPSRRRIRDAIADFLKRGEIIRVGRGKYVFNRDYRRGTGLLTMRAFKAIYVSRNEFTSKDVQRLAGISDRGFVNRILRGLLKEGLVTQICKRRCSHGAGAERVYHVVKVGDLRMRMARRSA